MSWIRTIIEIERIIQVLQVNLDALAQTITDQATVIEAVRADVEKLKTQGATLRVENEALKTQVSDLQAELAANNPATIQAAIDAVDTSAKQNTAVLVGIHESIPPDPPPAP